MPNARPSEEQPGIPEDYVAVPVQDVDEGSALRLCILLKRTPDPAAGQFILLRDLPEATVYLGCLCDAGKRLWTWVELWVQNLDGLGSSLPAVRDFLCNESLDRGWSATAEALEALNPEVFVRTGWETRHALPVLLDPVRRETNHPGPPDSRWELCRDDAKLRAAGLPVYSTSLVRYLHQPGKQDGPFLPVTAGAPVNERTKSVTETLENSPNQIPFNLQGGLFIVRLFAPIGFEEFADLLSGKGWKGIEHGKRFLNFGGAYQRLNDWEIMQQSGSHLFLGGKGKAGQIVETFHLKLQLLLEVFSEVRAFVEKRQLPFLNLSADSFLIRLQEVGAKLPFLWTSKPMLVKPGQAYPLPVETSDFRYFIRLKPGTASIYQPEGLNVPLTGSGNVRIRKVLPPDQGRTQLEATLVIQEGLQISPHDLIWVRLPLPAGRVDLYGHLYTTEGMAKGEARLRTVHQMLPPEAVKALRAAEGVSFARAPYEVVPLLSTPYDLYALGVLAVRTLLVNPQTTLAVSLDEIMSLGRRAAGEAGDGVSLASRIGAVISSDAKVSEALGPHRLLQEPMEPSAVFGLLPAELWYETLAAIIRLFPGLGGDSYCKDFGDAPALALEAVFNKPLETFEKLVLRSRSLIVIDWTANREVHSAIRDVMDRQSVSAPK